MNSQLSGMNYFVIDDVIECNASELNDDSRLSFIGDNRSSTMTQFKAMGSSARPLIRTKQVYSAQCHWGVGKV
jgi:hypothetical protein